MRMLTLLSCNFVDSTPPVTTSAENSIDEIQEIGKLKVTANTVEALVSDHLWNSEKWSQLELVEGGRLREVLALIVAG